MPVVNIYRARLSFGDQQKKLFAVEFNVSETDAEAWLTAADEATRAATDLGVFMASLEALSKCSLYEKGVTLVERTEPYTFPAITTATYGFDKLAVSYKAGIRNFTLSIPGRDESAYTVADDGITVITSVAGTAEVQAFVAAFNTTVLAVSGDQGTVQGISVSS